MAIDEAMGLAMRLLTHAQALAALTARLRLEDHGATGDPALRAQLDRVLECLQADDLAAGLTPGERAVVLGFGRSYLRQAVELIEEPTRADAWSHDDPAVLQAQGAASAVVASLIAGAGLGGPAIRILDVGTGVARLAIAFCEAYPDSSVVGLDPWEPALALARRNVTQAHLEDRITLLDEPVEVYQDADGFDLIWLPSFFIPEAVLDSALTSLRRMTRPGGVVVIGVSESSGDPLTDAVGDLMTVRSGGSTWTANEAIARVAGYGFEGIREVERTWAAPLGLVVGRQPSRAGVGADEIPAVGAETVPG